MALHNQSLQMSCGWLQSTLAPATHTPVLHASLLVQPLPSASQALPSALAVPSHFLVLSLHEPVVQPLDAQSSALPPEHTPLLHASPLLQNKPSSQGTPLFLAVFTHLYVAMPVEEHAAVLHASPAQVTAAPAAHLPAAHTSAVQPLPSASQAAPSVPVAL